MKKAAQNRQSSLFRTAFSALNSARGSLRYIYYITIILYTQKTKGPYQIQYEHQAIRRNRQ